MIDRTPIQRTSSIDAATAKGTGTALIVGALITLVFNVLHPQPGDTVEETMQGMVDAGVTFWKVDHLLLAVGIWLLAAGFLGIRAAAGPGRGAAWSRFGYHGLLMASALWIVHFALDGMAWATVGERWAAADGAERESLGRDAALLRMVADGLFPMVTLFYWSSFVVIGIGMIRAGTFPRWSAWSLPFIGAGPAVLAVVALFFGFSPTWNALFGLFATLTVVWSVAAGVWLMRRGQGPVAAVGRGPAVG